MPRHAKDERTEAERAGAAFDELLRDSEERAQKKRDAGTYPYDLEEGQ